MNKMATGFRNIYPIGQGVFYVEQFYTRCGIRYTIVYDCGSYGSSNARPSRNCLIREIESFARCTHDIDILFLSHFHDDHTNGIEILDHFCNIRQLVVPEFSNNEFLKASILLNPTLNALINNIPTLQVQPLNLGESENEEDSDDDRFPEPIMRGDDNPSVAIDDRTRGPLSSGTRILLPGLSSWVFIPIHYCNTARFAKLKTAFLAETKDDGTPFHLHDLEDADFVVKYRDKISAIYAPVYPNQNLYSMVLYSGEIVRSNTRSLRMVYPYQTYYSRYIPSGCLYTGDGQFNTRKRHKSIETILSDLRYNIGTIQLPHHGSGRNMNLDYINSIQGLNIMELLFFASYGTRNTFGHPDFVLENKIKKDVHMSGM